MYRVVIWLDCQATQAESQARRYIRIFTSMSRLQGEQR